MIYYICDRPKKENCLGNHCLEYCYHGRPHKADGCTKDTLCNVDCAKKVGDTYVSEGDEPCNKSIVVRCRPANKKELKRWGLD